MRRKKTVETVSEEEQRDNDPFSEVFGEESHEEYESEQRPATSTYTGGDSKAGTPWMSEAEAKDLLMDASKVMEEAEDNNPIALYEEEADDAYGIGHSSEEGIQFDLKKAVIYSEIINRRVF